MVKIKSISENNYTVELYSEISRTKNNKYQEEFFIRTEFKNGQVVETPKFKTFDDAFQAFDVIVNKNNRLFN